MSHLIDLRCLQIQLFSSLVVKELKKKQKKKKNASVEFGNKNKKAIWGAQRSSLVRFYNVR